MPLSTRNQVNRLSVAGTISENVHSQSVHAHWADRHCLLDNCDLISVIVVWSQSFHRPMSELASVPVNWTTMFGALPSFTLALHLLLYSSVIIFNKQFKLKN